MLLYDSYLSYVCMILMHVQVTWEIAIHYTICNTIYKRWNSPIREFFSYRHMSVK